jgi:hypothetical protein
MGVPLFKQFLDIEALADPDNQEDDSDGDGYLGRSELRYKIQ